MSSDANEFEYVQRIFEETFEETAERKKTVHSEMVWRRGLAYGLKAIPVFGGIAIAVGVKGWLPHAIGIAIMVAVAVDGFVVNHARLITVSQADKAFKRLLKNVRNAHQVALGPILGLKKAGDPSFEAKLNELNRSLKQQLDSESDKIEQALDEMDLKALNALSLEEYRKKPD